MRLAMTEVSGAQHDRSRIDCQAYAATCSRVTAGVCLRSALSSCRVPSADNGLGGWHSYRASKAALNMLLKNFANRAEPDTQANNCAGIASGNGRHLTCREPFQKGLPEGQLLAPAQSANALLDVIAERGRSEQSGRVFDWKGEEVPA